VIFFLTRSKKQLRQTVSRHYRAQWSKWLQLLANLYHWLLGVGKSSR